MHGTRRINQGTEKKQVKRMGSSYPPPSLAKSGAVTTPGYNIR